MIKNKPDQRVQLTWNNGSPQSWVAFGTSTQPLGSTYLLNTQVSSQVTSSGRYPWSVTVIAHSGATSRGR